MFQSRRLKLRLRVKPKAGQISSKERASLRVLLIRNFVPLLVVPAKDRALLKVPLSDRGTRSQRGQWLTVTAGAVRRCVIVWNQAIDLALESFLGMAQQFFISS